MPQELHWQAHEYRHSEKSSDWFWAVGIIGVSVAIAAIVFNNLLFAIFILLATFAIILLSHRPPHLLNITVNQKGITVGSTIYPFKYIEAFDIKTSPKYTTLLLRSKRPIFPFIAIDVHDISADDLRHTLSHFIAERDMEEPPFEKILDRLGI